MANLITLQAKKVKETTGHWKGFFRTEFYKDGNLYATVPAEFRQPRKGIKKYTLNCWNWAVEWIS